jgi:single-strand DNA-binding protein
MSDINSVVLVGRLTKEPELHSGETARTKFSIAVSRYSSKKDEVVSYFNCVAFGKTAETIASYVHKGHRIGVEGSIQQNRWTDAEGNKKQSVDVVVRSIMFLQPKDSSTDSSAVDAVQNTFQGTVSDDDLPF